MIDTIELIEMSKLVNTVVGSVFFTNENTNEIEYKPEYTPVVMNFLMMIFRIFMLIGLMDIIQILLIKSTLVRML